MAKVAAAAKATWGPNAPLAGNGLALRITYFYEGSALDVDNMVKPIADALIGVIYQDDAQLSDCIARKRNINGSFQIKGISRDLAIALADGQDFVLIELFDDPNHELLK